MKHKFLMVFTLLGALMAAQWTVCTAPPVDGFLDVPWGASPQQVEKAVQEKGFTNINVSEICLACNGSFAGYSATIEYWFNVEPYDTMYHAQVEKIGCSENVFMVQDCYDDLKGLITAKYGPPSEEKYDDNSPSFLLCKIISSTWLLSASNGDKIVVICKLFPPQDRTVKIKESPDYNKKRISPGEVLVIYCNKTLEDRLKARAQQQKEQKKKTDIRIKDF